MDPGPGPFEHQPAAPAVLTVDGNKRIRDLLHEYIRLAGYRAVGAAGPADGLARLEQDSEIAIVFTEVRLPRRADGIQFIEAVRSRWPALPLVAVTSAPDDLLILENTPAAPDLIVSKPFRHAQVVAALQLIRERH